MKHYICTNCGYRKSESNMLNHFLEFPVYPMYNASMIMPSMTMQYMNEDSNYCPSCSKNTQWMLEES